MQWLTSLLTALGGLAILGAGLWYLREKLARRAELRAEAEELVLQVRAALETLASRRRGEYLPWSKVQAWKGEVSGLLGLRPLPSTFALLSDEDRERHLKAWAVLEDPGPLVRSWNADFELRRIDDEAAWFDQVESDPLTRDQRLAIIRDEDNNLVVAGAGTGKTSTMVGKVGYLLRRGLAREHDILVLAFGRKAAEEVEQRIQDRLGADVVVRTFHFLGNSIIATVAGEKPTLSVLAEDKRALSKFMVERVASLLGDQHWHTQIMRFFTDLLYEDHPAEQAETPDEYYRRLKTIGLHPLRFKPSKAPDAADKRTLSDIKVKSLEEMKIGNWLTLNGIQWDYEPKYEAPTASVEHRQYQPDFYLPEYSIYIEHFGIQRDGMTAPGIDPIKYAEGMEWKRNLHRTHGTKLVESYSYDFSEQEFPQRLWSILRDRGVKTRSLTMEEIPARARSVGVPRPLFSDGYGAGRRCGSSQV